MRTLSLVIGLSACVTATLAGQSPFSASELEAFENFVQRPTSRVVWLNEIGRIETDLGHARVVALEVEDSTGSADRMRGIRVDVDHGADKRDSYYTSDQHLDLVTRELYAISDSVSSGGCHGSGPLRLNMLQTRRAFFASECQYGDWWGLAIGDDFRFTHTQARRFGALFDAASEELRARIQRTRDGDLASGRDQL